MAGAATQEDHEMTGDLDALSTGPDSPQEGVSHAFPEGGQEAWTCLLGSFLLMYPTFGFQTAGMEALIPFSTYGGHGH